MAIKWLIVPLLIAVLVVWWPGCRQYPAVTSRESLELVKLCVTAANTKDEARLSMAEKKLDALVKADKVTAAERSAFESIISMAKAGDWQDAEDAAFRFAQDQVGQGSTHPERCDHCEK